MNCQSSPKVAIVEDDHVLSFLLEEICTMSGLEVVGHAANMHDALAMIEREAPDMMLFDLALGGSRDGMELLAATRTRWPAMVSVLITGWPLERLRARIDFLAPDHMLQKPILPQHLLPLIETIVEGGLPRAIPQELAQAA